VKRYPPYSPPEACACKPWVVWVPRSQLLHRPGCRYRDEPLAARVKELGPAALAAPTDWKTALRPEEPTDAP
jgi:hypothetical protein